MTNTLASIAVKNVLTRLFSEAEISDQKLGERLDAEEKKRGLKLADDSEAAALLSDAYIAVSPEMGKFLYLQARHRA